MRRQSQTIIESPSVPFAEDLVFYAPLAQGDLTDHVSGSVMIAHLGSFVWDANKSMYRFTQASNIPSVAAYFNNLDFQNKITGDYTLFVKCIVPVAKTARPYIVGFGDFASSTSYKPNVSATCVYPSEVYTLGWNDEKSICLVHSETPLQNTYYPYEKIESIGNTHMSRPVQWDSSTNKCFSMLSIFPSRDSGYVCMSDVWIRDIRIYNRSFTAQEVAQL